MSSSDWCVLISVVPITVWAFWLTWENRKLRNECEIWKDEAEVFRQRMEDAQIGWSDVKKERDILKGLIEAQNKDVIELKTLLNKARIKMEQIKINIQDWEREDV
jgi:hypothetical protein